MTKNRVLLRVLACLAITGALYAAAPLQESTARIPRQVVLNTTLKDRYGRALSGVVGLRLALYKDQEGGAPLWQEVQNATLDEEGHYAVLLGEHTRDGLPMDLFTAGDQRWLGVLPLLPGEEERPRFLLVSVPYALKAGDSDTLGGKAASDFALRSDIDPRFDASVKTASSATAVNGPVVSAASGTGTANRLAKWVDSSGTLGDAVIEESGGKIGIGTSSPANLLHLNSDATPGTSQFKISANGLGSLSGITSAAANAALGFDVDYSAGYRARDLTAAMIYKTGGLLRFTGNAGLTSGNVFTQTDRVVLDLTTGNVGIGTTAPKSRLNIRGANAIGTFDFMFSNNAQANYGHGIGNVFSSASAGNNLMTFKLGDWTYPNGHVNAMTLNGAGNVGIGTITPGYKVDVQGGDPGGRINASGGLCMAGVCKTEWGAATPGHIGGTGTTNRVPRFTGATTLGDSLIYSGATNVGIGTSTPTEKLEVGDIKGNGLRLSPVGDIRSGDKRFLFTLGQANTFVGLDAGHTTTAGTTSYANTAIGNLALGTNTTGYGNTASGAFALRFNTVGFQNTATGVSSGSGDVGYRNTVTGYDAGARYEGTATGRLAFSDHLSTATGVEARALGNNSTATGAKALTNATAASSDNTATGYASLLTNTAGSRNTATGTRALTSNVTGWDNTAVGVEALSLATASDNTATGARALFTNLGGGNAANGTRALYANRSGASNTAIGWDALFYNTVGNGNTAIGSLAGMSASLQDGNQVGSNNTFIGYTAGPGGTPPQRTNAAAIGANAAVWSDNALVLGDSAVSVGIGTSTPTAKLDVVGDLKVSSGLVVGGGASITNSNNIVQNGAAALTLTLPSGTSITASSCIDQSIAAPGATTTMAVVIRPEGNPGNSGLTQIVSSAFVDSSGVIKGRFCNIGTGAVTSTGNQNFNIRVLK